jgi:hypothetical protein
MDHTGSIHRAPEIIGAGSGGGIPHPCTFALRTLV